jgi:uncharacterized protein (TIGR02466 family)
MRVESFLSDAEIKPLVADIKSENTTLNSRSKKLSHSLPIKAKDNPLFDNVSKKAMPYLRDFGYLLFGENLEWTVKEMWTNVLSHQGHQTLHAHANSFISGVLYLTDSHESAKTVFHKNMGGQEFVFSNTHAASQITPYNADRWVAKEANRGDLLLYPSHLLHAVPANQGQERISLAMNALPNRLKSWDYEVKFAHD